MLQHQSAWFSTSIHRLSQNKKSLPKNEILRESFQALLKKQPTVKAAPQAIQRPEQLTQQPSHRRELDTKDLQAFRFTESLHANKLLVSNKPLPVLKPLADPTLALDLKGFSIPQRSLAHEPKRPFSLPAQLPDQSRAFAKLPLPAPQLAQPPLIAYATRDIDLSELADLGANRRALLTIPTPPLPSFPTLDELETTNYSDSFELDLVCTPNGDHGFLFALTLIPKEDLQLPKIHQHFSFLIDRANSIQRERLLASKAAVMKAIEDLSPDDTFNIIVFDSKVEKLFSGSHPPDHVSIAQAIAFLDKINLGSFFAPADLYNPLLLTLPDQIADDAIHTAVLLTDGENLAKKNAMRALLQTWTWQNNGKVALFTVAMGNDPHLATLDVASAFNKGRLYYSPTKRGIKRKMMKLMKNIQTPVAKNISCRAISPSQSHSIVLFPRPNESPHLYLGQPFVIIGSCDSMDDFILFVQGRLKDRWMNIKKTISFVNAKKGGAALQQQWAQQQAYRCYERYVHDDNPKHLQEASQWLEPYDIESAFQ
ncbi:MAG: hypothetical protein HW387_1383 [Parachlamydiales bacterium]|nr:hypothetical protein [Parachlamydiales bacterium]